MLAKDALNRAQTGTSGTQCRLPILDERQHVTLPVYNILPDCVCATSEVFLNPTKANW